MRGTTTRHTAAVMMCALSAAVLTGCQSAPRLTNGSVSVCYRAIPVGRTAVHDKGAELIGVHRIPVDKVRSLLPASAQTQLAVEDDTTVCAMSFHGTFRAGQVEMAQAGQSGDYALVLVSSKHLHLVTSVVLNHLPRAFGGRTL